MEFSSVFSIISLFNSLRLSRCLVRGLRSASVTFWLIYQSCIQLLPLHSIPSSQIPSILSTHSTSPLPVIYSQASFSLPRNLSLSGKNHSSFWPAPKLSATDAPSRSDYTPLVFCLVRIHHSLTLDLYVSLLHKVLNPSADSPRLYTFQREWILTCISFGGNRRATTI